MSLPPPRDPQAPYTVAIVCLGNICRSPMAHVVLAAKLAAAGLAERVHVTSSGTGDWHLGQAMDERAASTLTGQGYDATAHRARQFDATWFADHDLILAMDQGNQRDITALSHDEEVLERVRMFRSFDPEVGAELDVPDPWYGGPGGFDDVLAIVERTTTALVTELAARQPASRPSGARRPDR